MNGDGGVFGLGDDPLLLEEEMKRKLGLAQYPGTPPWMSAPGPPPVSAPTTLGRSLTATPQEIQPGPASQRYQVALAQPEPQLHGLKRGLDIAGRLIAPGIE